MGSQRLIDVLAKKHNDWFKMAKSLGCTQEEANDLVQQMYLKICYIGKNKKDKILLDEGINTMYIYNTIKNLYKDGFHLYTHKNHVIFTSKYEKEYEPVNIEKEKSFNNLLDYIDKTVDKWYWYDKKMWEIHFKRNMSMREINRRTKISLSSIFETLNYAKKEIKKRAEKLYQEYKRTK